MHEVDGNYERPEPKAEPWGRFDLLLVGSGLGVGIFFIGLMTAIKQLLGG
jgi:hypothetical protein